MEREVYDMIHLINKTNHKMLYMRYEDEDKIDETKKQICDFIRANKMVVVYSEYHNSTNLYVNNFLEAYLILESELDKYIQKNLTYINEPNKKANKIEKLYFWNQISCDPNILSPNILRNADGVIYKSMDEVIKDFKYIWNKRNKMWQDKTRTNDDWNILNYLCAAFEEYIEMHGYHLYKSHWDYKFPKIYKYL